MTKIDDYRKQLTSLEAWDSFLLKESGLPGPRGNIELAQAVADEGDVALFMRYLSYDAQAAPTNSPYEFLAFCGVLGMGRLLAAGQFEALAVIRQAANDPRWRMREGVAMALQRWGRVDMAALLHEMSQWSTGTLLEQRAAIAAICEPDLLSDEWIAEPLFQISAAYFEVTFRWANLKEVKMTDIITISLKMPMNFGSVNCYLVKTEAGYILIDTGMGNKRLELENKLESAGCKTGSLNLIVITHGDFDHIGNAAYLRNKYAAKIAMHPGDAGMAQKGDMFFNRKKANALLRALIPIFSGFKKADRFTPDIWLEEGAGLSEFGLEAQVLSIPGHSKGSIGILTAANDLFCGDLFDNTDKPTLNAIMDDNLAANASLERLVDMRIKTVYPGHGQPFPMQQIINQLINPRYAAG